MMKRLLPLLLLAAGACGLRSPISHSVTIAPSADGERVTVVAATDISITAHNRGVEARQNAMREAILDDRDDWSRRLRSAEPESERTVLEKRFGTLQRVERTAVIRTDELQRVFSDVGITIQMTRGDGWSELAIYPASSTRATREQRELVEQLLEVLSRDTAEYFRAVDRLYSYLRTDPMRAEAVFTLLFADEDERSVIEEEDALIRDVIQKMEILLNRIGDAERDAVPLDEAFDLVLNPFPAEITVNPPRAAVAVESFERRGDDVFIPRKGLLDVLGTLEGRWIAPDPLALLMRADEEEKELPPPKEMAAIPRKSTAVVTPAEIQEEVLARFRPAAAYRVRWID